MYPAVQNFPAAARAEGPGCVLTTRLCFDFDEPAVKALPGIPEAWGACAHVPVDWPVRGGHGSIQRRPMPDRVDSDARGVPWS